MCKNRWRPYITPSPVQIITRYGQELGQAIIKKNIEAVSDCAITPGKWLILFGGNIYPSAVNRVIIPTVFDNPHDANDWLLATIPAMDLAQPEQIERSECRIAYRTYSLLTKEYVVAEALQIDKENLGELRRKYISFVSQTNINPNKEK